MPVVVCSSCAARINVKEEMLGRKAKCPKCATMIVLQVAGAKKPAAANEDDNPFGGLDEESPPPKKKAAAKRRDEDEDDEGNPFGFNADEEPEDDEDDDAPRRKSSSVSARPMRRAAEDEAADDEDADDEDDEDDDRPSARSRHRDDEDEDDEDDRGSRGRHATSDAGPIVESQWSLAYAGIWTVFVSAATMTTCMGLGFMFTIIAQTAMSPGLATFAGILIMIGGGLGGLGHIVGQFLCLKAPKIGRTALFSALMAVAAIFISNAAMGGMRGMGGGGFEAAMSVGFAFSIIYYGMSLQTVAFWFVFLHEISTRFNDSALAFKFGALPTVIILVVAIIWMLIMAAMNTVVAVLGFLFIIATTGCYPFLLFLLIRRMKDSFDGGSRGRRSASRGRRR